VKPNSKTRQGQLKEAPIDYVRALHRGWVDKQNGHWWEGYERASKNQQLGYEAGRLFLANVLCAGGHVPIWRGTKSDSQMFNLAVLRAHDKVGEAVPPTAEIAA
jgi:hypothetical protein